MLSVSAGRTLLFNVIRRLAKASATLGFDALIIIFKNLIFWKASIYCHVVSIIQTSKSSKQKVSKSYVLCVVSILQTSKKNGDNADRADRFDGIHARWKSEFHLTNGIGTITHSGGNIPPRSSPLPVRFVGTVR